MPETNNAAPAPVSLREAFWYWLKLGFISFGGPAGQIAIMHHDLVEKYRDFGGVRIEDNILVTPEGHRILGKPIPKTVAEIEGLV